MELVDRYVEAVRKQLPRGERDDIAAELRETLQSQIEDLQTQHGRAPTEDDVALLLQRYGAPEIVAARYGVSAHLIGPSVYRQYRATLRIILSIVGAAIAFAVVSAVMWADRPVAAAWRALWIGTIVALAHYTVVTLVFARVERLKGGQTQDDDSWNPRALARAAAAPTSVSRAEAGASLAFTVLFLLWWFDLVPINHWLIWSRAPLAPAPVWDALTALIVALACVTLVTNAIVLARKQWVRFYDAAFVLVDAGILFVLFEAMRIPNLILPTDATSSAANLATLLDRVVRSSLFIWALLALGNIAFVVWRWLRVGHQRGSIQNWAS